MCDFCPYVCLTRSHSRSSNTDTALSRPSTSDTDAQAGPGSRGELGGNACPNELLCPLDLENEKLYRLCQIKLPYSHLTGAMHHHILHRRVNVNLQGELAAMLILATFSKPRNSSLFMKGLCGAKQYTGR